MDQIVSAALYIYACHEAERWCTTFREEMLREVTAAHCSMSAHIDLPAWARAHEGWRIKSWECLTERRNVWAYKRSE